MTATPSEFVAQAPSGPCAWRGRAYALEMVAPAPIVGIQEHARGNPAGRAEIRFVSTAELDAVWGKPDSELLFALHYSDGKPFLTVEHAEGIGYRVWAPYHGRHLVSEDGTAILCAAPSRSGWWWQRLVLAQVLPIAAAAQGLVLLHAAAVVLDEKAVAITAEAGTGKTTLAANLVDRGAVLLADDVLALEPRRDVVLAHPGARLVNIDPAQHANLGSRGAARLQGEAGKGDKLYVLGELADTAQPLAAVYFLRRRDADAALRIGRERDARKLLGSGFVPYLKSPDYRVRHLDVCSRIADEVPVFTISAPRAMPADELAAAVAEHLEDAS